MCRVAACGTRINLLGWAEGGLIWGKLTIHFALDFHINRSPRFADKFREADGQLQRREAHENRDSGRMKALPIRP
jgi:hypothetical protein